MTITTEELAKKLGATDLRGTLATNPNHQWQKRDVSKLEGLCIHQALGWSSLEAVAKYHTGSQSHLRQGGVHSISYTIGIRLSGEICILNDLEDKPWSQGYKNRAGDENAQFLSVVNQGLFRWKPNQENYNGTHAGEPTANQLAANLHVWNVCADIWDWDIRDIYGHYHFGKEACPGTTLRGVVDGIRNQFHFDEKDDRTSFLKIFGFKSTLELQQAYNAATGAGIDEDNLWGGQSTQAALWWAQHGEK